jgi:uncharacterized membrane protein YbhN (UPF0104 family)
MCVADTARVDPDLTGLPSFRQVARKLAVSVVLAAIVVLVVTALPGLEELPAHLAGADPVWVAAAVVFELASTVAFAFAFHGAYERRTTRRASASVSMAMQGMNIILPAGGSGGLAVGAVILDRAGVPRPFAAARTVALFLATSMVSFAAVAIAGFGLASGLLPGDVAPAAALGPAIGAVLVVTALIALTSALRPSDQQPAGRVRRAVWGARVYLRDGVAATSALLRTRDRLVIGGSVGYFAFDVAALAASFHAIGSPGLPIGVLVLAYTLGHAGAIVPLPGSAEGGLIGMFVLYGVPLTAATAAVLAYRVVHAGVPLVLGSAGLADVRRRLRSGTPLHAAA